MAKNTGIKQLLKEAKTLKNLIHEAKPLRRDLWPTIEEKLRIDWTYNSNALEGNTLTYGETDFFLREGLTSEGRPLKDYLEAKNHAEAIDGLAEVIQGKRKLTEGLIKEFHGVLMRGIEFTYAKGGADMIVKKELRAGAYKLQPNHVLTASGRIHYYADPLKVKDEMEALLHWYHAQKGEVIETAAIFHYRFVAIHPFDDGNGRIARILMNLILMKNGYPPCIIRNEKRRKYLSALERADGGVYEEFIEFVAEELVVTMRKIWEVISDKKLANAEDKVDTYLRRGGKVLNFKQREQMILDVLEEGPLAMGQIVELLGDIKRPTLKLDLRRIVKAGKAKKHGEGRGVVYEII